MYTDVSPPPGKETGNRINIFLNFTDLAIPLIFEKMSDSRYPSTTNKSTKYPRDQHKKY